MFGGHLFNEIGTDIVNDLTLNESKDAFQEVETRYPTVMDNLLLLLFAGLWIAGIVAALMSDQHPAIFAFLMIMLIFVIFIAGAFANFYEELFSGAEFGTLTASYPKSYWIMTHLIEVTVAMALSIILALLGKNRV